MAGESNAPLQLESITHRYGRTTALADVSLGIEGGEFVTLLGPSGCGKTTLLRVVAGFAQPTAGRVLLDGREITRLPAHKRPVNMVFQRSTLFPHLDVFENVAFGLRIAGVPRDETKRRVNEALALVQLPSYGPRRSHELSGGQMQRVALARALVNRPRVLLLDEPLSALDLKIRLEMEVELRRVHRETGATFIYVTHDQREALALSDRVVVFDHGRIEQVGTPGDVYARPASPFTARFVGDANVLAVEVTAIDDGRATISIGGIELTAAAQGVHRLGMAWLVLRPEVVRIGVPDVSNGVALRGVVRDLAFRGAGFSYRIEVPTLDEPLKVEAPAVGGTLHRLGSEVIVTWDPDSSRLLPGP